MRRTAGLSSNGMMGRLRKVVPCSSAHRWRPGLRRLRSRWLARELAQLSGGEQGAEAWEAVDLGQALAILAVQEQRGQVEGVHGGSGHGVTLGAQGWSA